MLVGRFLAVVAVVTGFSLSQSRSSAAFRSAPTTTNARRRSCLLWATSTENLQPTPQVIATGYSQAIEMTTALEEAVDMALEALPVVNGDSSAQIDLAVVSVSSLYDGNSRPSDVVPTIMEAASSYGSGIQYLIGGTNGGFISSLANLNEVDPAEYADNDDDSDEPSFRACRPIEREGVPGVSVTLMILPDVEIQVS